MKRALLLSLSLLVTGSSLVPHNCHAVSYHTIAGGTLATIGTLAATTCALASTFAATGFFSDGRPSPWFSNTEATLLIGGLVSLPSAAIAYPSIKYASNYLQIPQSTFYKIAGLTTAGIITAATGLVLINGLNKQCTPKESKV